MMNAATPQNLAKPADAEAILGEAVWPLRGRPHHSLALAWRDRRFQPSVPMTPEALEAFLGTKKAPTRGATRNISA